MAQGRITYNANHCVGIETFSNRRNSYGISDLDRVVICCGHFVVKKNILKYEYDDIRTPQAQAAGFDRAG